MQAVTFSGFGGPEVLTVEDVDAPRPGVGQVRIAVRAAAVNALDWKIRRGFLAPNLPPSLPAIPGYDVAGVIDLVGDGVTEFAVGDEVMGASITGSYAQQALADVTKIVAKPAGVAWEVAGGFDSVALTAHRVLAELGVTDGAAVLVHGASGAVGQLAVQLAVALGAQVIGSASAANQEQVRALGAIPIVYGEGFAERAAAVAPDGIDFAADIAGKGDLAALIELTSTPDRVLTIADPKAGELGVRFSRGAGDPGLARPELVERLGRGELSLAVERTFPLAEAGAAQAQSEAGHARGRLVLIPT